MAIFFKKNVLKKSTHENHPGTSGGFDVTGKAGKMYTMDEFVRNRTRNDSDAPINAGIGDSDCRVGGINIKDPKLRCIGENDYKNILLGDEIIRGRKIVINTSDDEEEKIDECNCGCSIEIDALKAEIEWMKLSAKFIKGSIYEDLEFSNNQYFSLGLLDNYILNRLPETNYFEIVCTFNQSVENVLEDYYSIEL